MATTDLVRDLNARIEAEFARHGREYRDRDGQPYLYIYDWDGGFELCDCNDHQPLTRWDVAEGGIEQATRDWIDATS